MNFFRLIQNLVVLLTSISFYCLSQIFAALLKVFGLPRPTFGRRFAFVLGVTNYGQINYAAGDCTAVCARLMSLGFNTYFMMDADLEDFQDGLQAIADAIENNDFEDQHWLRPSMEQSRRLVEACDEATLRGVVFVFFHLGHSGEKNQFYLAQPTSLIDQTDHQEYIQLEHIIYNYLNAARGLRVPKTMALFLSGCRSELAVDSPNSILTAFANHEFDEHVLYACQSNKQAFTRLVPGGRDPFNESLLKFLKRGVSMKVLGNQIREHVQRLAATPPVIQTPEFKMAARYELVF